MTQPDAINVTKEGVEVKPGQVWKDLDTRSAGRQCKVMEVVDGKARMQHYAFGRLGSKSTVSIRRMHEQHGLGTGQ